MKKFIILFTLFFVLLPLHQGKAVTDTELNLHQERERCCCSDTACSASCVTGNEVCTTTLASHECPLDRCTPPPTNAQAEQDARKHIIVPQLQINIPTLAPFKPEDVKIEGTVGNRYVVIPFLAQYIVGLYKFGIGLAFLASVVIVMFAGFRWMTAGGNASTIGNARDMIGTTVIGLVLLLGSYLILNTVNPDLIKSGVLRVKYIEPSYFEPEVATDEDASDSELPTAPGDCSNPSFVINSIDGVDTSKSGEIRSLLTHKDAYQAAAGVADVPWEVLAAVHYKEANGDTSKSALNGGVLCNAKDEPDLLTWCGECKNPSAEADLICAGKLLKRKVGSLSKDSSDINAIKLAFCKYNGCGGSWKSCPEKSPYVAPLFDANHQNYTKQHYDCIPAQCNATCTSDATVSPRSPKNCCSIKVFAGSAAVPPGFHDSLCNTNVKPSCKTTEDATSITYTYNPNKNEGSNQCGSWVEQKRLGALTIYALLKKSE